MIKAKVNINIIKILHALAVTTVACLLLPLCKAQEERLTFDKSTLIIISPHDEMVRKEITWAFKRYAKKQLGRQVELKWQPARGTGNILRLLENEKKTVFKTGRATIDIFLGGGAPAHEKAKKLGIIQPVELPARVLNSIPEKLGGVHMRDPQKYWFGVTVSSFGIIYNKKILRIKNLPPPTSWADLAKPDYYNMLILADPYESGSARACYEMIMQKFGWQEGWKVVLGILANANYITHASSDIAREVSDGQAAAGMVIDLYAFVQIKEDGQDILGFVLPEGESAFTPDPVSVIARTPKKFLATKFVEFLLSQHGQKIWILKPGLKDGPRKYPLFHFPTSPSAYKAGAEQLLLKSNPFNSSSALHYDEAKAKKRSFLLTVMIESAGVQNRKLLKKAWLKLNKLKQSPNRKCVESKFMLFYSLPFTEGEGLKLFHQTQNPMEMEKLEEKLYMYFKRKYRRIINDERCKI